MTESQIKIYILTHGVDFTEAALEFAEEFGAKRQNMVYNAPVEFIDGKKSVTSLRRPQELFLIGLDGYKVCVSAVSPIPNRKCAVVDYIDGVLKIATPTQPNLIDGLLEITYVKQPEYYSLTTSTGRDIKRIVSSCGYNEMNIWPWHDCAIKGKCSFCGINTLNKKNNNGEDMMHALELGQINAEVYWKDRGDDVKKEICEAIELARYDECFTEGIHLIMITGNLDESQLNLQAQIYADISYEITKEFGPIFREGIVAVTAPPNDLNYLQIMKDGGVDICVLNLEAYTPAAFDLHCKGKSKLGRDHYIASLEKGVEIFGYGKSWTNFVLGLEDHNELLNGCIELAKKGINPGANVLHIDYGSSLTIDPPTYETVIEFYTKLADILREYKMEPYYSEKALRTSLTNEAYAGRF